MVTKPNSSLPILQKAFSFKDQNFLSLVILGLIFAIYLTIYWRFNKQEINEVFVLAVIYACFFFKFYQKQNEISFSSSLWSQLTGLILIFLPLFRAKLLLSFLAREGYILAVPHISVSSSLISIIGYIILIIGFKGLKQFQQELIFLGFTSVLIRGIQALLRGILTGQSNHSIVTDISAQITTFFLWYLGFNATNEGSIVHVNGGGIDVYMGCTGWDLFFLLSQLSVCVLFLFRSSLKNIFLPFLLSFLISFILSIIRLIIMALVVKDDAVFDYWHVGDGSSLFSFGGMILFWGVIFLKLPSSLSFALPSVNFRTRPNPFLLTVSVILGIIFSSFSLFFYPIAGINTIAPYNLSDKISLANWQLTNSYPSSLTVKNLTPKVSTNQQEENSEIEDLGRVVANQIYHYKNNNDLLKVKAHYIVNTSGKVKDYYKKFQEFSQLENTIEKQGKYGSYLYFINDNQPSLTACINYQGKTTVTSPQFISSLYRYTSSHTPLLNWLMGKAFLNDKRCLLLEVSIDGQSSDRDAQLMGAWTELVSYWQKNFPPLRS
jgi:cyanoexosortase A